MISGLYLPKSSPSFFEIYVLCSFEFNNSAPFLNLPATRGLLNLIKYSRSKKKYKGLVLRFFKNENQFSLVFDIDFSWNILYFLLFFFVILHKLEDSEVNYILLTFKHVKKGIF